MVVANLQLSPPVVYVLEGAHVAYRVELLKQGKVQRTSHAKKYLRPSDL